MITHSKWRRQFYNFFDTALKKGSDGLGERVRMDVRMVLGTISTYHLSMCQTEYEGPEDTSFLKTVRCSLERAVGSFEKLKAVISRCLEKLGVELPSIAGVSFLVSLLGD